MNVVECAVTMSPEKFRGRVTGYAITVMQRITGLKPHTHTAVPILKKSKDLKEE